MKFFKGLGTKGIIKIVFSVLSVAFLIVIILRQKIFEGTKKYEYRRKIANKEVSSIVVYSILLRIFKISFLSNFPKIISKNLS